MKGIPIKRQERQVTHADIVEGVLGVEQTINNLKNLESNLVKQVDTKIEEVENKIEELETTVDSLLTGLKKAHEFIEDTKEEALQIIDEVKEGRPGKDADEEYIVKTVLDKVPKIDKEAIIKEAISRVPKLDEKKLKNDILSLVPRKSELNFIKESVDPQDILEKMLDLDEDKLVKLRLKLLDNEGLHQTIRSTVNQLKKGYLHGGGISDITGLIDAGTDITITGAGTATDPYVINSTGGGSGTPGGSTTQLQYNNAGAFGGILGATTNGTAVTYTTGNLIAHDVKASQSAGIDILSNAGTVTALFGAGGGANSTFYGGSKFDYATASTISIFDASKNLISADTATYPSLTELSYVKGVTSSIQTQLNSKISGNQTVTLSGDITGSGATSITTTIANGAVDIAMLSATGTPDGTTYLRGDNTWATVAGGGTPGGLDTEVQYNNSGAFGGASTFTFNAIDNILAVPTLKIANDGVFIDENDNEYLKFAQVTDAINYITFQNADSGNAPMFLATGDDTDVPLAFKSQGAGSYNFLGESGYAAELRLYEDIDTGTNFTAFKVGTQSADLTYILPTAYPASTGYVLSSTDAGVMSWESAGVPSDMAAATFYDNTGGVALTTSFATINLDATMTNNATGVYTLASGQVTVAENGYYIISYNVGVVMAAGTRGSVDAQLQVDTGGGMNTIDGSQASSYWRDASGTGSSVTKTIVYELTAGDIIQLQAKESVNGVTTIANNSTLSIVQLKGTKGDTGATGPAGTGDVSKVGTPLNNQIGVWTGDGTIEGQTALTYNGTTFTMTPAINAGGATSFEIPNGAGGTTVNATGEICVDSTSRTFNFYDGTVEAVINPVQSKTITLTDPSATEDITMFYTDDAITVTKMVFVITGSTSATTTIRHHTDRNNAGNEIVTGGTVANSTTTGNVVTSFNDATIPADSFVWLETTALSGTPTSLSVTVFYRQDA